MKTPTKSLAMCCTLASLIGLSNSGVYAQDTQGKWSFGLRGGISVYTQDIASGVDGDAGPIVSGVVTYGVSNVLSIGFNTEWETHDIDDLFGDANTVSLLPFIELRKSFGQFTPYAFAGAGININWFAEDQILKSANIKIEPENTFAFKGGVGADYFFTPSWALNTELGWKLNDGQAKVKVSGNKIGKDDFNASAFSALVGIRYYF